MPRNKERTIWVRPRDSNVPPVTETGGEIYDGTISTDMYIIKMTTSGPVATK